MTAPATPGTLPTETIRVNSSIPSFKDVDAWANVVPVITINPSPLDFGGVILPKFKDLPLTIINNSNTIDIPNGTITIPNGSPFSCASSCDYPSIPHQTSVQIMMRYKPTAVTPANDPPDSGVGTLSTSYQDNKAEMLGTGLPIAFQVKEK
jgi:hypothetical protein